VGQVEAPIGPVKRLPLGEVKHMSKSFALLVLLLVSQVWAQQSSQITVKTGEVNNGVVIVTAQAGKTHLELQCNKGSSFCEVPKPGNYLMVRLPKNYGLYDCQNVDVYPASADPKTDQKLGQYCLTEEK
jgi:hypothetical protein